MPRKGKTASNKGQNEDSKSVTSHRSGSKAGSQRGTSKSGRKGAKGRGTNGSERSASKSRPIKEEYAASQPAPSRPPIGIDPSKPVIPKVENIPAQIEQQKQIAKNNPPPRVPPQAGPRQIDPRVAAQAAAAAATAGSAPRPGQPQMGQRMPSNIPPQITAADVARARSNMPSDTELVEAKIAGEKIKASVKTIEYLRRFEGFLNKNPSEKINFLNEKFFRKIPRDNGVFKTNRGKEVKCPVCMEVISSPPALDRHFSKDHRDLVQFGMECTNGEFKISNKIANVVAMF